MTRKNIFEILEEQYNISKEFDKITTLFNTPLIQHTYEIGYSQRRREEYTLEQIIDIDFYKWRGRGTCISYKNMREELGIDNLIRKNTKNAGEILHCLEYYENINSFFIKKICPRLLCNEYSLRNEWEILIKNICILLDHLNYEKVILEEEEKVILIPKNPAATAVAEISSEDTAMAILMYHHTSLKGQLAEKKDILRRIAQEYEPILDKPIEGYTDYFKTAANMLNNLDIRHNNKAGKNKNALATNLSDEKLENWYDELYQLLLFCVLIKDNKKRKDKMSEFLKGLNKKEAN